MTRDLDVIVVSYNSADRLPHLLESVRVHAPGARIVVVDNASADGSVDVARMHAGVDVLANTRNVGFGAAVNQAARVTGGRWMLVLNPDCEITAGVVDAVIDELERHPQAGAIGPGVLNEDGTVQGSARGDPSMITGLFGRTTLLSRLMPWAAQATGNVIRDPVTAAGERSVRVDWVSGACMFLRREAFERVQGFDEGYFLYWEDADLCRRLREAGYETRHMPGVHVRHAVGQSSRTARALAIREFHRSAYRYYRTWSAPGRLNPLRGIAWLLLRVRCAILLRRR